ncbi:MAG: phosphoribosylglycinamide formyltransferase [Bacteroidota bacterium]|nr:phosphoribosylglycinamide formyltransferase [Bacteroidota bacterium]
MPLKIALLASGSGSNAENIVNYFSHNPDFDFPVIISNKPDAFVHQRAKKLQIASFTFSREEFSDGAKVLNLLKQYNIDCIVLVGFLLKIPQTLINVFPGKIINIHPALLPKHGGKGMYGMRVHQAVCDAGDTESGITIHYVNSNYDEGSIIFQAKCPVLPTDTPDMIAEKVHALEYEHFPKVIEKLWGEKI